MEPSGNPATELRPTGIATVPFLPWGTHFCHFYKTNADLLDILVPYFKTGLENNEFCMWIAFDRVREDEARNALREAIPEIDLHFAAGDLELLPYDVWYVKNGVFDLGRVIEDWKGKLSQSLSKGYAGMRANGDESWLTDRDWDNFTEYEGRLKSAIAGHRMLLCCSYPIGVRGGSELFDVARTHDFVMAKQNGEWQVLETPALFQAKEEIKLLNEALEERVLQRTIALGLANEELKREILEHKNTLAALRQSESRFRELSEKMLSAREEEGTRIAREIHDELGSSLSSLKWDLDDLSKGLVPPPASAQAATLRARVLGMIQVADDTIRSVRRIASELRPNIIDDLGLIEALQWQGQQFQERTGIPFLWMCSVETAGLLPNQATAVFRIFQESLTNILRHSEATAVEVTVAQDAEEFVLTVVDNGKGITKEARTNESSLGLIGMEERARLIGGTISIGGAQGGTTVKLKVRLTHATDPD